MHLFGEIDIQHTFPFMFLTKDCIVHLIPNNTRQFLDSVEEGVAVLDNGGVLCVARVGSERLNDATHFVDLAT